MSMNLVCKECTVSFQTPTYITEMCFWADLQKQIKSPWQTILNKYLSWVAATIGNHKQEWIKVEKERKRFLDASKQWKKLTFEIR